MLRVDAACVAVFTGAMDEYQRHPETTFAALRAAAGRRTRIVIGSYDGNPILEGAPGLEPGPHEGCARWLAAIAAVVGRRARSG